MLHAHVVEMEEDYTEALQHAEAQDRPLLVYLYMLNCKSCDYMDHAVFTDERIVDYLLEHYVVVHLYTNDRGLPSDLQVEMSPVFHFIDSRDGEMIESIMGGRDPERFLELLKKSYQDFIEVQE